MALYVSGTSLLLHGNGADGSTVFTDETGKTITASGNARISTAQSKFGGSSMYFDGAGSCLTVANQSPVGTEAFTIDMWFFVDTLPSAGAVRMLVHWMNPAVTNGLNLELRTDAKIGLYIAEGSLYAVGGGVAIGNWYHLRLIRAGNHFAVFLGGVLICVIPSAISFQQQTLFIGRDSFLNTRDFAGYLDDFHLVRGVALSTEDFTLPITTALPLSFYAAIQAHDPGITEYSQQS